ncbi:MAG TPA: purine-nucleoside phosphorylase [Candidatus Atribacteria bacterium]|nr:purine-nucleoside phosphorylase [Candidatus Atribacteria bacterium]
MVREQALLSRYYPEKILLRFQEIISSFSEKPQLAIVAGSGWEETVKGELIGEFSYPYLGIPFFTEVEGHAGKLCLLKKNDFTFLLFSGRLHLYQGYSFFEITLPVVFSYLAGVEAIILTNAAGSLSFSLPPGSVVIITDQVDFTFYPDPILLPPPFFDEKIQEIFKKAGRKGSITLNQGVYTGVLGPSFETPAEIRFLSRSGDMVGMSTVKESKLASFLGLKVGGISLVTNWGAGMSGSLIHHQEVLEIAVSLQPLLQRLFSSFLEEWSKNADRS